VAWTREDTKDWIGQLEHRIEDIDYYLWQTVEWCETHGIYEDEKVFACALMTVIWVSHVRSEPISKREVMEILGVKDWHECPDEEFILGSNYRNLDIEDILYKVVKTF
jgi:hypothetical protein